MTNWPTYDLPASTASAVVATPPMAGAMQPVKAAVPWWLMATLACTLGLVLALGAFSIQAAQQLSEARTQLAALQGEMRLLKNEVKVAKAAAGAAELQVEKLQTQIAALEQQQAAIAALPPSASPSSPYGMNLQDLSNGLSIFNDLMQLFGY